ncbi:MAG TPA: outer membrane beta-barrel protein, partial [Nitrospirota bacterium]|nr:outer membrane beta-barrel protein [Nitrospirota bacterium]
MKKFSICSRVFLWMVIAVIVLPAAALAQGPGLYIGAGAGMSEIDSPGDYADFDDTDTAVKVFMGYAFNKGFALEAGYADLGSYT